MSTTDKQQIAEATVRSMIAKGATAADMRAALGKGAHLVLSGALKRLGAKPSKAGTVKGKFTAYADDTTFSI